MPVPDDLGVAPCTPSYCGVAPGRARCHGAGGIGKPVNGPATERDPAFPVSGQFDDDLDPADPVPRDPHDAMSLQTAWLKSFLAVR